MSELLKSKASLFAALLSTLLGAIVITGWYLHSSSLIQVLPQFAPMQYNTALGFLFSGIGLLAVINYRYHLGLWAGVFVSALGVLTLSQYIFNINLGIDQLIMEDYINVKTSHLGRMAPNTALCFLLTGIALSSFSLKKSLTVIEILALFILSFSVMALIGYIVGEENGYAWGSLTGMALHTTTGFIILGFGILFSVWEERHKPIASIPLWAPALLCFVILTLDMISPKGVSIGVAYAPLVFFSLRFRQRKVAFVFAGLSTVLIILGYMASPYSAVDERVILINRSLAIIAVWVVAYLVYLQKVTQSKLKQSEETLTLGWRGAGDGMWDWNIEDNSLMLSDRFKQLLGYKPDELRNHFDVWVNRLHADDKERALLALEQHLKYKAPYNIEYRLLTQSGEYRWFLARGQALWNDEGKAIRVAGSLSDITERKKIELELRLLKLAVENSTDLIMITEANIRNPKIIFVNKASLDISGYEPEEMIGKTPSIFFGEETDLAQLKMLGTALKNNKESSIEIINYSKEGRAYWINVNTVLVKDKNGVVTHFAGIGRDITAAKEAEIEREELIIALEKSNDELDNFAYVASHDLKAPLRVIENVSNWLEEDLGDKFDDESKENMGLLRSRVNRMDALLDDLLEYSRIGRKLDADYVEFIEGVELIQDITLLVNKPDAFTLSACSNFLSHKFNKMPLRLILLNLVSNAIKHHDKESGVVEVCLEEQDAQYLITVTDDGPGISKAYHEKIFKMFQTLKPRDRVEGSGMGLAIVRKHIELLGGVITLDSDEGRGCAFSFTWPKDQIKITVQ